MVLLFAMVLISAGIRLLETKRDRDSNKMMLQELKEIYEYHTESFRNSEINIEAPIEQLGNESAKELG